MGYDFYHAQQQSKRTSPITFIIIFELKERYENTIPRGCQGSYRQQTSYNNTKREKAHSGLRHVPGQRP